MKYLHVILTAISLILIISSLVVVESSSSSLNDTSSVSKIIRGSSLSTSSNITSRYWVSPSGNFAFGFNVLPCPRSSPNCTDTYVVGIWSGKTLVWMPHHKDLLPLHEPSSIHFTNQGNLVLRVMPDNKEIPLIVPDIQIPVSYAMMHDNGNFVLYGLESQIVWESFDYPPTDTILGGRKLRPGGVGLIYGGNRLSIQQINNAADAANSAYDDQDGVSFPQMSKTAQRWFIGIFGFFGVIVFLVICCGCYCTCRACGSFE